MINFVMIAFINSTIYSIWMFLYSKQIIIIISAFFGMHYYIDQVHVLILEILNYFIHVSKVIIDQPL